MLILDARVTFDRFAVNSDCGHFAIKQYRHKNRARSAKFLIKNFLWKKSEKNFYENMEL